jgi:hypothetical protein
MRHPFPRNVIEEAAMRRRTALRPDVKASCADLETCYVAVLRIDDGTAVRSVPFADRETAEKVARYSLLDADVLEARVEEVRAERPAGPPPLPPW